METVKVESTQPIPTIATESGDIAVRLIAVLLSVKSDIKVTRLTDSATWADLHLDSLDLIAVLVELENEFDLPPDAIDFQSVSTYGELKAFLQNHLNGEQVTTNEINSDSLSNGKTACKEVSDFIEHLRQGTALPFIAGQHFEDVREKAALYQTVREWMETKGTTWYGISLKGGSRTRTEVLFEGGCGKKDALVFSINHYLGLHRHIGVIAAAQRAVSTFGAGCGTSSTSGGYSELHKNFERAFCEFIEKEAGIVFPTGYTANVGAICALVGRGDRVVLDREIHASVFDGCRLSGAKIVVFAHNDVEDLKRILRRKHAGGTTLVVLESVYSMGGADADLRSLVDAAHEQNALVMVDESHAFGFYGTRGAGASEAQGVLAEVDIYMTTMSKSLASVGGIIAGNKDLIELIRCTSRSLLFQACAPASSIAAAYTALDLIRKGYGRNELWSNTEHFRDGVKQLDLPTAGTSPIVPVFTASSYSARQAAKRLLENGIYTPPITYPAVAHDQSRLRFTISAEHKKSDLDCALHALDAARPVFAETLPIAANHNGFPLNNFNGNGEVMQTKFSYLEELCAGVLTSEENLLTLARKVGSLNGVR